MVEINCPLYLFIAVFHDVYALVHPQHYGPEAELYQSLVPTLFHRTLSALLGSLKHEHPFVLAKPHCLITPFQLQPSSKFPFFPLCVVPE